MQLAQEEFKKVLGDKPNQIDKLRGEVSVAAEQLTDTRIPSSSITEEGFRNNVDVALQYLNSWLLGNGAAAIHNLMEDAATAEISRAQLWQWIRNAARLADGQTATTKLYEKVRDEEVAKLGGPQQGRLREAVEILDGLVLSDQFGEFLTNPAYRYLD